MNNLKLYKIYLVYGKNVVMYLCWALSKKDVYKLIEWKKEDRPIPIIKEIPQKEGCCACHHIADFNFCKHLTNKSMQTEKVGDL